MITESGFSVLTKRGGGCVEQVIDVMGERRRQFANLVAAHFDVAIRAELERLGWTAPVAARPLSEYHEEMGPVTWWRFPVEEAAWIGTPNDSDWPGCHTHFTPHPVVPTEVSPP